mmetsp:Transcript_122601/g.318772  ORF Transcript_122601/g.318772 Transcript_122601/m.318772 type:complete len:785 (-) Transcript_122601:173-2527(-)
MVDDPQLVDDDLGVGWAEACATQRSSSFRELLGCLEAEHAKLEEDFAALQARHAQLAKQQALALCECAAMRHIAAVPVLAQGPPAPGQPLGSPPEGRSEEDDEASDRLKEGPALVSLDIQLDLPTLPTLMETAEKSEESLGTGSENQRNVSSRSWNTLQLPRHQTGSRTCRVPSNISAVSPSLSKGEPALGANLELWPDWVDIFEAPDVQIPRRGISASSSLILPPAGSSLDAPRSGDTLTGSRYCKPLMMAPSSAQKICWDLLSFFLMGYDILMIPMAAFTMPSVQILTVMDWTITCFWTLDIVLTFFVGFYDGGILDMRPARIASRYFRSWFFADVLVVGVDWLVIAMGDNSAESNALGVLRIGKSVRILRVLRMFRLLRILKVLSTLEELSDFVHSESLHTGLNIIKLVVAIAVVNHFIACGWYALGTLDLSVTGLDDSWVKFMEEEVGEFVPLGYRYATSLHWSLTQFTPASMEVVPRNSVERVYAIAVILLALVMFSSFVSSITSAMTHLRALREEQRRQQENVRRYIAENKLSMELGNRVHAFIRQHHKMAKARVRESDIAVFRYLPEHLRFQMRCEVYAPTLVRHPLFAHVGANDSVGMARICHIAASQEALLVGEELFHLGQIATKMFFMTSGNVEYQHHSSEGATRVEVGARISEIVLWAQWEHQGRLLAVQTSELVAIDSARFRSIARRRIHTSTKCAEYAAEYVSRLAHAFNCSSESMSDIWDDGETIEDMAMLAFGEGLSPQSRLARKRTALPSDFAEVVSHAGEKLRAALQ